MDQLLVTIDAAGDVELGGVAGGGDGGADEDDVEVVAAWWRTLWVLVRWTVRGRDVGRMYI